MATIRQTLLSRRICLMVMTLTLLDTSCVKAEWTYHDVRKWSEHFPSCNGPNQSPIDLDSETAEIVQLPRLFFGNYHLSLPEMVTNNGYTVTLTVNPTGNGAIPFIQSGGLKNRYNFVQAHFHWGPTSDKGSEHLINSWPYAAELHFVHYNTKYRNFKKAVPFADGLAVLAVLVEVQEMDNEAFNYFEQFSRIIEPDENKPAMLAVSVPLFALLPSDTSSFYRYNGSLTAPDCNENVIWTVFDTPIAISERQLDKFRKLNDRKGKPLAYNFRSVQPLNDRIVTYRESEDSIVY